MDIGEEQKTHRIEPAKVPIPEREPATAPPKTIPQRTPSTPEKAPVKEPAKT